MFTRALAVAVTAAAVAAVPAFACAPTAGMALGGQAVGPSGVPPFHPGGAVTIHGTGFAPEDPVTLRWGVEGPAVGETPVSPDGTWTLTVSVPTAAEPGTHMIVAEAGDDNGFLVTVGVPVEAAAPPSRAPLQGVDSDWTVAPTAAVAATQRAEAEPKPQVRSVQPAPAPPAAPRAVTKVRHAPPRSVPAPARVPVPARRAVRPPRRAPTARRMAPLPPRVEPPVAAPAPRLVAPVEHRRLLRWLLAAAAVAVIAVGAVLALVGRRRRRRLAAIEAELQEIVAEERARQLTRARGEGSR